MKTATSALKFRTEIKLNFRRPKYSIFRILGRFRKVNIGFRFELASWIIAYDFLDVSPGKFAKLSAEQQNDALIFGAAKWDRMQSGKKVFFSHEDIKVGLDKATKEEIRILSEAIKEARFPDWLKEITKK